MTALRILSAKGRKVRHPEKQVESRRGTWGCSGFSMVLGREVNGRQETANIREGQSLRK